MRQSTVFISTFMCFFYNDYKKHWKFKAMPDDILAKADTVTLVVKIIQCTLTTYTNSCQHLSCAKSCLLLPGHTDSISERTGC